ncbi:hypothetical protein [Emticicia aquatilis]|nr:hypothetical protein [Emticicia aquatilis]
MNTNYGILWGRTNRCLRLRSGNGSSLVERSRNHRRSILHQ